MERRQLRGDRRRRQPRARSRHHADPRVHMQPSSNILTTTYCRTSPSQHFSGLALVARPFVRSGVMAGASRGSKRPFLCPSFWRGRLAHRYLAAIITSWPLAGPLATGQLQRAGYLRDSQGSQAIQGGQVLHLEGLFERRGCQCWLVRSSRSFACAIVCCAAAHLTPDRDVCAAARLTGSGVAGSAAACPPHPRSTPAA